MRKKTRLIAVVTLVLLGAPLALHVVAHDLHDDHSDEVRSYTPDSGHGDHEHPVISAVTPRVAASFIAVRSTPDLATATRVSLLRSLTDQRNTVALGAMRLDDDIGLHSLLSTYLI